MPSLTLSCGESFEISLPSIITEPDFKFKSPSNAFIAVDLPAPLGPRIETISPLFTLTEQELMISGPLPYPPVIFIPSKKAISFYPLILILYLNNFQ